LQSDVAQNKTDITTNATDIESLQSAVAQNATDINDNAIDISQNTADITTNTNNINAHTTLINANTTSINTLNTQCTDITYDLTSDTTTISNKLTVKAVNDWSSFINRRAQFVLTNDTTSTANQYDTKIYAGATYGVATTSLIANINGATCIVNTRQGSSEDSTAIVLCGHHASIKRGLKIALDGNISEYHGGSFVFYTSLFIQPTGKSMMDVYTHFFTLSQSYTNMLAVVNQNTTNITVINTELDTLTKMTYDLPSDTTTFDSRLWCQRDIFVVSDSYGTISLVGNRIKILTNESDITAIQGVNTTQTTNISNNTSAITAIQGVNTTQDERLSNIEALNTTQTANIATNTAITSLFTYVSNVLSTVGGVTQFVMNQNLSMTNHAITNVLSLTATTVTTTNLTIGTFDLEAPMNVLRCTLKCDGSGVWSMINNHGFNKYYSASGPGLGPYVEKQASGQFSILCDLSPLTTDVCVTATGIRQLPSTSYFDIMQISCTNKAYYGVSGVNGYNLYFLCASLNAGILADIYATGYIDIVVHY
jgi:hypothetical protein